MRIVFTKRQSVADIMCNLIKSVKAFTTEEPKCVCKHLCRTLRTKRFKNTLPPPLNGHVSVRAADLPKHLAPLRDCLKNIPVPDNIKADQEVYSGFKQFYRNLCKLHTPDRRLGERKRVGISFPKRWKVTFDPHAHR